MVTLFWVSVHVNNFERWVVGLNFFAMHAGGVQETHRAYAASEPQNQDPCRLGVLHQGKHEKKLGWSASEPQCNPFTYIYIYAWSCMVPHENPFWGSSWFLRTRIAKAVQYCTHPSRVKTHVRRGLLFQTQLYIYI